jgi:hypothetical protein
MAEQLYSIKQRPDTEEYHIFYASWNDADKTCVLKGESICKKMNFDKNAKTISGCQNEKITRVKAAEIGRKVCGICVSNLYTTYDD